MSNERITLVSKKDLEITWFNGGGGGGGQYRNRHNNCCRIVHPASGAQSQSTTHRDAPSNQKEAFEKLCQTPEMKFWITAKIKELQTGQTIEERVQEQLRPENLKIEVLKDGQWVEAKAEDLV